MTGAGGPPSKGPRTSLVDTGWDTDPDPETIDDVTITDVEPLDERRARATIDLDEQEVQTVSMPADALRQLAEHDPHGADTQVTHPASVGSRGSFDFGRDSAVDDLLESEEGRRLESAAPPPHHAPTGTNQRPLPLPSRQPATPGPPAARPFRAAAPVPPSSPAAQPQQPLPSFDPGDPLPSFADGPPQASAPSPPSPIHAPEQRAPELDAGTLATPATEEPTYVPPRNPPARVAGSGDDTKTEPGTRRTSISAPKSSTSLVVMVLGVTVPLAVGAGIWIGKLLFAQSDPEAAVASTAPSAPPPPSATAPAPQSLVEKARTGDFEAIEKLEQKQPTQRSVEETLAIAIGRSHNKQLALEGFKNKIEEDPSILEDEEQLRRLRDFIEDRETTNQAAAIAANLNKPISADLLYEVWVGVKERNETTELAEQLVYSPSVREHASPALQVALDLRKAEECEEIKELLPQAHEHGDRRSLHLLGRFLKRRGCGPDKSEDCYECLRPLDDDEEAISVIDAIRAVRQRPAPRLD